MAQELDPKVVDQAVKTIQMLSVDAVQKANSGHPGAPMGLAAVAFEIWTKHLRFDPRDPAWPNRDRFVLSCGHASMLLYSLLHLGGYDVSLDDIKSFRQWGSKTPGHPEVHVTPGVETTTGPLGQGISNAVGMATGLKMMAARFDGEPGMFDARVFGLASDGDLMEGVSHEACSLAGHLGLGNLVFVYDDNGITIDGSTELAFSEQIDKRFESYGWHVEHCDGHDHASIAAALDKGVAETGRPSLIIAKTTIGKGSPNRGGKSKAHGEPLGDEEIALTKEAIGWPLEPTFRVPDEVKAVFAACAEQGGEQRKAWDARRDAFVGKGGEAAELYDRLMGRKAPSDLLEQLLAAVPEKDGATRALAGAIQQRAAELVPSLVGGSADLTGSTKTYIKDASDVGPGSFGGRNFYFGVREHGMAAMANGMALGDGFIPYVATFMVFSDYLRPALRLAGLSKIQSVYVLTHDSMYLGEDGPTHQPVEHYWALRCIPNVDLWRPCDAVECAAAWTAAVERRDGPTAMALTRQGVPKMTRPDGFSPRDMLKGAYTIAEADGDPAVVIIATGSEVAVAVEAKQLLGDAGTGVRVVSAPCWDAFLRQDDAYRDAVIPKGTRRVAIELGVTWPWRGVVGDDGLVIGHDGFGFSAPWKTIRDELGHSPEKVAERIRSWMG